MPAIDRRTLLVSAAATAVAGMLPRTAIADVLAELGPETAARKVTSWPSPTLPPTGSSVSTGRSVGSSRLR